MSRNIKEIGKELMGKSLNSFHRKTGLTQLEKNNEMQDGILNGILSQVDDAYIEKTEQSNVIHLDGSGDGVVVLDSIEGNTERLIYTPIEPIKDGLISLIDARKTDVDNSVIKDEVSDNELVFHNFSQVKIQNDGLLVEGAGTTAQSTASLKYRNTFPRIRSVVITLNKLRDIQPSYLIDFRDGASSGSYIYSSGVSSISKFYVDGVSKTIHLSSIPTNQKSVVYIELPSDLEDISPSILSRYSLNEGMNAILYSVLIYDRALTSEELQQIQDYEMSKSFELKSSFEENIEDNKYKIEILSNNKSLIDWNIENLMSHENNQFEFSLEDNAIKVRSNYGTPYQFKKGFYVKEGEKYTIQIEGRKTSGEYSAMYMGGEDLCYPKGETYILVPAGTGGNIIDGTSYGKKTVTMIARKSGYVDRFNIHSSGNGNFYWIKNMYLEKGETVSCIPHKSNKIKLLLNEPLRAVGDIKDVLCIKDNKLLIERKLKEKKINGTEGWSNTSAPSNGTITYSSIVIPDMKCNNNINNLLCDKFPTVKGNQYSYTNEMLYTWQNNNGVYLHITTSKLTSNNVSGFKTYLQNNNFKFIYELKEPYYEEVLNEYGEPILLEGYENGTIYIDSTIVPTTTVRYTPKMESFKTLKEVENNNIMLTNDVNDNIIPYMMDVDLMIMEKEMALMSHKNIRTIGVKDMTSMQKRTQDMLTRLIKGKTLTEQECKTRVTTYLNAGKITDAQAEELMLLIDEVYA